MPSRSHTAPHPDNGYTEWNTGPHEVNNGPYTQSQADVDLHTCSQRVQAQLRANMAFEPWC